MKQIKGNIMTNPIKQLPKIIKTARLEMQTVKKQLQWTEYLVNTFLLTV